MKTAARPLLPKMRLLSAHTQRRTLIKLADKKVGACYSLHYPPSKALLSLYGISFPPSYDSTCKFES